MGPTRYSTLVALFTVAISITFAPRIARAQEGEAPPDSGGGDVFDEPFEEPDAEPPELPEADETEGRLEREQAPDPHADNVIWTLRAGGNLNYGNTHTAGVSISSSVGLRRGNDVVVVEGDFRYTVAASALSCGSVQAAPMGTYATGTVAFCGPSVGGMAPRNRAPGFNDWTEIVVAMTWRLRWDHFVDPANAFFIGHRGRIDRFAGLRPRVSLNFGYSRLVFEEPQHLLAFDLGLDGTFDFFTDPIREQTAAIVASGRALPVFSYQDRRFVPSVRVGLNYVNHLNPFLTYDTTFDAYWDVVNQTHLRFEWINHLRTAIDQMFQVQLDVTLRLDSLPPGQAVAWAEDPTIQTTTMFEVLTTLSVQGTFDLDGPAMYRSSIPREPAHTQAARH